MVNRAKTYTLPDQTVTDDIDQYIAAWRKVAQPIEMVLDLELMGFDPDFTFRKGSAQYVGSTTLQLPVWFVNSLSNTLLGRAP